MNTLELSNFMLNDKYIRQHYGGVFASNTLPILYKDKKVYIINTDPSHLAGEHWVVVYTDDVNEYFDSLAHYPNSNIEQFLRTGVKSYLRNSVQLQLDNTSTCGLFCLFYCYFRCRGYGLERIVNMFNHNHLLYNEFLVKEFYN